MNGKSVIEGAREGGSRAARAALCVAAALWIRPAAGEILVQSGIPTRYLVNVEDPGIGTGWVAREFDDGAWSRGPFGIGHEQGWGGVKALLRTEVQTGTRSVYTRTPFRIDDVDAVHNLFFGIDYDDGFVAWINGHEIARSANMPAGAPQWDSEPASHESSNGASPSYAPILDLSETALPLLRNGDNVLALGVWNHSPSSRDLVAVPLLVVDQPLGTFVERGPYLQSGTDSSVVVRWRTSRPTDGRVAYGTHPERLGRAVVDPVARTDHEIRIGDLDPGTRVYYSVGTSTTTLAGGDEQHAFTTAPRPGTREPFRAWVIGDAGTAGFNVESVRRGFEKFDAGRHVAVWLTLGDNAYPDGTDEDFQRALFDTFSRELARTVLWSVVGNHDGVETSEPPLGVFYDVFTLPSTGEAGGEPSGTEAYYSFDYANVHFIGLNSENADRSPRGPMVTWLERDLARSRADWIVAFWHHAPYSTGLHDSDKDPKMVEMRTNVLPLLDAAGADLVLSGHTHAYERSYLIHGHYGPSDSLGPEMVVDGGDGRVDGDGAYRRLESNAGAHGGIVYVVAGSSGEATEDDLHHPAMTSTQTRRGSLVLDFAGDRLDARFVGVDGDVIDDFTIVKEAPQDLAPLGEPERPQAGPR